MSDKNNRVLDDDEIAFFCKKACRVHTAGRASQAEEANILIVAERIARDLEKEAVYNFHGTANRNGVTSDDMNHDIKGAVKSHISKNLMDNKEFCSRFEVEAQKMEDEEKMARMNTRAERLKDEAGREQQVQSAEEELEFATEDMAIER